MEQSMNTSMNYLRRAHHLHAVMMSILTLLVCFSFLTIRPASAAQQNTAYLPLQVIAPQSDATFAAQLDSAFAAALADNNFLMVDRQKAQAMVDYSKWPPDVNTLAGVAEKTGYDNVAAGSFTLLGEQISVDIKVYDILAPDKPKFFFQEASSISSYNSVIYDVIKQVIAYTERDQFIASITPEGNKRIDSGAILRKIQTKTGDSYSPARLREDLKAIYKLGYFDDVQIDIIDGERGKEVTFIIVEKPTISSITYSGLDELAEKDLAEVITIKENGILNPARVNAAAEAIKALYRTKGYYNTEVTPNISYPTPDSAAVRFVVAEGKKIYIKTISFEGNTTFDQDDLEDVVETSEKGWLSWLTESGLLNTDLLNQDAARIVAFYHNNGFLEARVGEPIVTQDEEWLFVKFNVQEGPRFKVGTVGIEGDLIADKEVFLNMLSIRSEEYLSRKTLRDDILKITDYYSEQGYAFAEIRPKLDKSSSGTRVDVNLVVNRGDLVYINRVSVRGNSRTRDNVIRRELKIEEGGVFDAKALRQSSQALQRLDFFEEVDIAPDPALDPSKMNITINVKEKSTGQFSVGAGYSSVDKLVLMGEISENNFLGMGHRLSLSGNIGGSSSRFNLSWTNPRLNDSNLSVGGDLFNWRREYDDYTRDSKGGALRLGHPLWGKWRMYESYSYTDTQLSDVDEDASYIIQESQNVPITSAVKASFVRDTRDKLYGATRGSRNNLSVKYAGGILGGDSQFTKLEGTTSWYFPLFLNTVFHALGSAGAAFENEPDKLPVYERFYLGGMSSIRGYEYAKVSPIDPETGDRIGGDQMWFINTEIVVPLLTEQGIYGVVFFDAGDAIDTSQDFTFNEIAKGTGVELRWLSPMGPLRVVYGYNIDPLPDEPQTVWDFSIGGQF
jgi:outer membrane protein insertion porin family